MNIDINDLERLLEKATPRPWEYETGPSLKGRYHTVRGGNPSVMVCECYEGDEHEQEANARFICQAVNSHYELVEALEAAKELFELDPECGKPGTDAWAWLKQTEEVLAKARGQS